MGTTLTHTTEQKASGRRHGPITKAPLRKHGADLQEGFTLEKFMLHQMMVANAALTKTITDQHLSRLGLTFADWEVLCTISISDNGCLSPTKIMPHIALADKVRISRILTKLSDKKIVRITKDPDDGRGRLVRLTKLGTKLLEAVPDLSKETDRFLSSILSENDRKALVRSLNKITHHLQLSTKEAEAD